MKAPLNCNVTSTLFTPIMRYVNLNQVIVWIVTPWKWRQHNLL